MDFTFTQEDEELRRQVRAFLAEHLNPDVKAQLIAEKEGHGRGPLAAGFLEKVVARGWVAMSWPRKYGGQGGSRMAQYIVEEEFYREAQLVIGGGGTGAPAILAAGTEEQKQYYLPRCIRMEISFCQGYSEPHCGTDLAGIRCRATRHGGKFIVRGQKIFTTGAHNATHIFLMVRTDPHSARQKGLSVLLVPMDTPGITVRPLWTIQHDPPAPTRATYAEWRTNEVFFDDVEVPESCLLGVEGDGWAVARRGLNLDRVGAWRYLISVMRDEDIVNLLKQEDTPVAALRADPLVRDKVAQLWTEAQVCRLMTMRSLSIEQRGGEFVYEGSAEKVWAPEHGVRSTEAIAQLLGPYAQLLNSSPHALEEGVFAHNMLGAFQSTVNHGSVQVMRDQVARVGIAHAARITAERMMDILPDDQMREIREAVRGFLGAECPSSLVREVEVAEPRYSLQLWRRFAELGWASLCLPEDIEGQALPLLYLGIVFEEMGRHIAPMPLHSTVVPAWVVARYGCAAQRARLKALASGDLTLSFAVQERTGAWWPQGIATVARRSGSDIVIDGAKYFVDGAQGADYCLVLVRVVDEAGRDEGPALAMVDMSRPGIGVEGLLATAKDAHCTVKFDGVRLPAAELVGTPETRRAALDALQDGAALAMSC